ncbi:MAG: HAD family hydrolase [Trueperaceae bacterium]
MSRAVSFDLDGVVMDNPFATCVLPRIRLLVRGGSRLSELPCEQADELIDAAIYEQWAGRMARGETVAAFDWDSIYNIVSRNFGGPLMPSVAGLVEECCRPDCIRLLAGVHEGIELLRQAGYRTLALTNGYSHYQAPVLAALGVSELFDQLVAPNDVDSAKPDLAIFRAVPGLAAHVGDTLYADVLGARQAGLMAVWLAGTVPPKLRALTPVERLRDPGFAAFLAERLNLDPHREWYSEATPDLLQCHAVAQDVKEAAEAVIEVLGPA